MTCKGYRAAPLAAKPAQPHLLAVIAGMPSASGSDGMIYQLHRSRSTQRELAATNQRRFTPQADGPGQRGGTAPNSQANSPITPRSPAKHWLSGVRLVRSRTQALPVGASFGMPGGQQKASNWAPMPSWHAEGSRRANLLIERAAQEQ